MGPCIECSVARSSKGYGSSKIGYGPARRGMRWSVSVHRFVFEQAFGPIPPGLQVCHTCDNPACINVHHLFLGTDGDNMRDAVRKGRLALKYCGHYPEYVRGNEAMRRPGRPCPECARQRAAARYRDGRL